MSWSVTAIGKPEAVRQKLTEEFEKVKHLKGIEDILKMRVADLVDVALRDYSGKQHAVQVIASGSASSYAAGTVDESKTQNLSLEIKQVYGFCDEIKVGH